MLKEETTDKPPQGSLYGVARLNGPDAYTSCTLDGIRHARQYYAHLFNQHETKLLQDISSMDIQTVRFMSRMALRKHSWVRSSSITAYFPLLGPSEVQSELGKLADLNIILILGKTPMKLDAIWTALTEAYTRDEWKALALELKLRIRSSDRSVVVLLRP
jgi:hypothetical protein